MRDQTRGLRGRAPRAVHFGFAGPNWWAPCSSRDALSAANLNPDSTQVAHRGSPARGLLAATESTRQRIEGPNGTTSAPRR
jgi:hypothetical protein